MSAYYVIATAPDGMRGVFLPPSDGGPLVIGYTLAGATEKIVALAGEGYTDGVAGLIPTEIPQKAQS